METPLAFRLFVTLCSAPIPAPAPLVGGFTYRQPTAAPATPTAGQSAPLATAGGPPAAEKPRCDFEGCGKTFLTTVGILYISGALSAHHFLCRLTSSDISDPHTALECYINVQSRGATSHSLGRKL